MASERQMVSNLLKRPRGSGPKVRDQSPRLRGLWNFALFFGIGALTAGGISFALRGNNRPAEAADETTAGADTNLDSVPADDSAAEMPEESVPKESPPPNVPVTPAQSAEARACFQRGYQHSLKEQLREALQEYSRATALDPTDPLFYVGMGKAYEALHNAERAMVAYRKAIQLDPKYHGARVALAELLCDFGKNEESLALLQDSENTEQRDPKVWAEIALNKIRLGNPQEAVPLLQRYSQKTSDQEWGHTHLGRAQADVEDFKAAEAAYRRGLAIDPYSERGNKWLAELLRDTGREAEAGPYFERFREVRKLQTEKRQFEQALARPPGDLKARVALLVRLADVRRRLGQNRQALVSLQNAINLTPGDPRLKKLYADQLRRANAPPKK